MSAALALRLTSRIERRGADECWEWRYARSAGGYGQMWHAGRVRYVHRLVYEMECGPIPAGAHVLHSCDNPPCCNPAHLRVGTHADNMDDMRRRGRANGGTPKLTREQASALREAYAHGGVSQRSLARSYGITQGQVSRLVNGVTYGTV
jgi:hypothetical protein